MVIFTKVVCLLTLFSLSGMLIFHFIAAKVLADMEYEYLALGDVPLWSFLICNNNILWTGSHIGVYESIQFFIVARCIVPCAAFITGCFGNFWICEKKEIRMDRVISTKNY